GWERGAAGSVVVTRGGTGGTDGSDSGAVNGFGVVNKLSCGRRSIGGADNGCDSGGGCGDGGGGCGDGGGGGGACGGASDSAAGGGCGGSGAAGPVEVDRRRTDHSGGSGG